jgi:hypothetical protein
MREKVEREGVEIGRPFRRELHGESSHFGGRYSEKTKGFVHHLDRTTTSFYFTNFPGDVKVMELWGLFSKHGRVGEVYIPRKLDNKGHKFGFVKFKEVTNVRELEERLSNVWWGSFKLRINLSRFNRRARGAKQSNRTGGGVADTKHKVGYEQGKAAMVENGKSFKMVLTEQSNKEVSGEPVGVRREKLQMQQKNIVVDVKEELWNKLCASFVGFLMDEKDADRGREGLVMEGYGWITSTYMGGNMILLSSSTSQLIKEAIGLNMKWWVGWFRSLLEWSPNLFSDRRNVWLSCRGVPLHAWDEPLFRSLAEQFGVFLEMDEATAKRSKLP